MKSVIATAAFSAWILNAFAAPIADRAGDKLIARQTTVPVSTGVTWGDLTFEITPSVEVSNPAGSGVTGDASVSATFTAIVAGPTSTLGSISGDAGANASLDPGNRGASTTLIGEITPDGALTGAAAQSSNTGDGSAGAGGNIEAYSGGAESGAGVGVGSDANGAGGGVGGGSDADGYGAGGGSGANVSGGDNYVVAGILTGADPNGAWVDALTEALSPEGGAVGGTEAGSSPFGDFSDSVAAATGSGSNAGAGSGAGGPDGDSGVDTGVNVVSY